MRTLLLSLLCLTACDSFADIERFDADTVTGWRGRKLEIRYLEGQKTSVFEHADAGLEITVERSINDYDEERIELLITVASGYPDELRTTVEDLFIDYRGKRYRGFNGRWGWIKHSKADPSFPPGEIRQGGGSWPGSDARPAGLRRFRHPALRSVAPKLGR